MADKFVQQRAGERAALTKALDECREASTSYDREAALAKVRDVINRAPAKGFTAAEIIERRIIPNELLPLITAENIRDTHNVEWDADKPKRARGTTPHDGKKSLRTSEANRDCIGSQSEISPDVTLEPDGDEQEFVDDDRPVFSKTTDWTITSLREKWDRGLLEIQPDYQREYVWRLKPELPSRLIESVLLEIPIPPLYFGQMASGNLEVIDGQQRLTTLIKFMSNDFALLRLARMPSLNGKKFRDLSRDYQEKIKDTPVHTVVINVRGNSGLRFEIFERLNRGSIALNEQEIRNCIYRGPFNSLLGDLEKDSLWRRIKGGESPEPRFKEREMILRILAFANRVDFFKSGFKRFLNEYMEKYAPRDPTAIDEQAGMFRRAMQNVIIVFGNDSGKLYSVSPGSQNGHWDRGFSIAALEIQASALLGQDPVRVQKLADQIREQYLFLLLTNKDIQTAISKATANVVPTKLRWRLFRSQIQPLIDDVHIEPRFYSYETRKELFDRKPICEICHNQILTFEDSTVDHIMPYSGGGKTILENGQLAHRLCNASKNAISPLNLRDEG